MIEQKKSRPHGRDDLYLRSDLKESIRIFQVVCFFLLFLPFFLQSFERLPWFEKDLVFYGRVQDLYQHYSRIQSTKKSFSHHADDQFVSLGLSASYSPWSGDIELVFADTNHQHGRWDHCQFTGSYQWMDDIVGDFASVVFGVRYVSASKSALHDVSSFHHGQNEVELSLSVGKEQTVYDSWGSRYWGIAVFGLADHGSPWWRMEAAFEKNWQQVWALRFYANALYGMGGKSIHPHHFKGYGPIKHRSLDMGLRLTRQTEWCGTWSLECAQRVYSRNFPKNATLIQLEFIYS